MSVYAMDSNIISFYLRGNVAVIRSIEKSIGENRRIVIPPIAYYEVKRGLELINASGQMRKFETLRPL